MYDAEKVGPGSARPASANQLEMQGSGGIFAASVSEHRGGTRSLSNAEWSRCRAECIHRIHLDRVFFLMDF